MAYKNIILWLSVLIMVLSAIVQLNDPDPFTWIAAYLLVAFLGFRKIRGNTTDSYWAVAIIYLIWGINQFPPEWEGVLLDQVGMKTLNIELGRESLGLIICAAVLTIYSFIDKK
ncbi:transmembrane 220 family protein [uncultured Arcticibacterium sp.]|uniref:transmembrane 220 family protein n=1 Tax=uncultured Arcticibacterium sp. TaxID=2173042 RepID=UPI0030FC6E49